MSYSLQNLLKIYADYNALNAAMSLMSWDQQVLMPPGGAVARAAHMTSLNSRAHALITSDEVHRLIEQAEKEVEPGTPDAAQVSNLKREVAIESKLPASLVDRKATIASEAYQVWKQAKAENNFPAMVPYYQSLFDIAGETAECLGFQDHIYDALIDLYEEGATWADADGMFRAIKSPIVSLVRDIRTTGKPIDDSCIAKNWDRDRLRAFAEETVSKIGFDFSRGRLNLAPNAFCMNLSCGDVRMTTRASNHLKGIFSSSLHEMGHALYEQNSPIEWDRTPLAGGISLAVHESQSRLWENIVGRSKGFWNFFFPRLQSHFPELSHESTVSIWRAINKVEPEFIRVGADELTYNLHILIRFELEVEILTQKLRIQDLPEAWNAKYSEYLGITPDTNTVGCLQDVHWSKGSIGYFPTYSMGNLIGGQMWKCLLQDLGDVETLMAQGDFGPILSWLTAKVYQRAKVLPPKQLVTEITGRPMEATDWLQYAQTKYKLIYEL